MANFVVAACAVAALLLVVTEGAQQDAINRAASARNHRFLVSIQHSRVVSVEDNCLLLRRVVIDATPKRQTDRARRFIKATPLRDCHAYALRLTGRHPPVLHDQ